MEGQETKLARRVMVVADPTRESASALQYALAHVVLEHDELILFSVENQNTWRNTFTTLLKIPSLASTAIATMSLEGINAEEGVDFLEEMKNACKRVQPKLSVRAERMGKEDGKDKANTILHQSDALGIDIIIIGQRRRISKEILGTYTWPGAGRGTTNKAIDTADYLIENSKCACVAVQKKGQDGGYLLNSRTHKNFWLLA
ncbi:unnamed protein product [Prunus armeniaca]|uniref:Uncharacterized protein n=1 Tax=Prunus armeniaca TaxID=36596 RepID=A0A6J5V3T4_PRUAR|nr:hypothetical protein GBA52_021348 [Prunus armeniaca]CAB4282314.1 unnamed protein product [Prunus armeniaca]CAB4312724.1 unnamed protein product [Prunus armeniaca]